jgi:hypothetical protein
VGLIKVDQRTAEHFSTSCHDGCPRSLLVLLHYSLASAACIASSEFRRSAILSGDQGA